jgi:hypothetical protein
LPKLSGSVISENHRQTTARLRNSLRRLVTGLRKFS